MGTEAVGRDGEMLRCALCRGRRGRRPRDVVLGPPRSPVMTGPVAALRSAQGEGGGLPTSGAGRHTPVLFEAPESLLISATVTANNFRCGAWRAPTACPALSLQLATWWWPRHIHTQGRGHGDP